MARISLYLRFSKTLRAISHALRLAHHIALPQYDTHDHQIGSMALKALAIGPITPYQYVVGSDFLLVNSCHVSLYNARVRSTPYGAHSLPKYQG